MRCNWPGDHEESSPDAYLDGHPHYPSISRRVSFTIRSQSEEQPGTPYISDSGLGSSLQSRRRHPSWTTLSSSGGGTILRRTRRTSRYVSDTLNALGENSMLALPEETANSFMAELAMRDFQALTPDMVLHEPEYWNRYELEVGEEGEGGATCHEQVLLNQESSIGYPNPGWPHLEAYITPQVWDEEFQVTRQSQLITTREEVEARDAGQPGGNNHPDHDDDTPVNDLLRQWNTQSTIGDVLRDFHYIIAYVLEGMQQYEAGMAPWPRVPQDFDQRMRSLNVEDTEGNISIASASRRVLSLLEGTGIPQTSQSEDTRPQSTAPRVSRIPRLVKKDSKVDTTPLAEERSVLSDKNTHAQASTDQRCRSQMGSTGSIADIAGATAGNVNVTLPGPRDNTPAKDTRRSRNLSYSILEDSERPNNSRSPNKRGPRTTDLGHTGSKAPALLTRSSGGNTPGAKAENVGRTPVSKGVENSPVSGRRGRLMAGEMRAPTEFHFSRGRKLTRDDSLLADIELVDSGHTTEFDSGILGKDGDDGFENMKENCPPVA